MPVSALQRRAAPQPGWLPWLLLGCGLLVLLAGWLHEPMLGIAAVSLLLLAWLPSLWRQRSVVLALAWLALATLTLVPASMGRISLALAALPVVILSALAWLFARTLRRGEEPLVTRFIRVIEGEARLGLPGVRAYGRGVTLYWVGVLGALALMALLVLLFAEQGWLSVLKARPPFALPDALLTWYPEGGCWALLVLAFAAEYAFRRWHLRGLPHPSLRRFLVQLARRWPQLIRDGEGRG